MTVAELIQRLQEMPHHWVVDARLPMDEHDNAGDRYVEDLFEVPLGRGRTGEGWVTLVLGDES